MSGKRLGQRAWDALETPQGYSFISDDICYVSDEEAYQRLTRALPWARQAVSKMARLIRDAEAGK